MNNNFSSLTSQTNEKLVVLYARTAVKDRAAIKWQKVQLKNFAKSENLINIRFLRDNGKSGANFSRPAFRKLEKLVEAGQIGTIVITDYSRLSRDLPKLEKFLEFLKQENIQLVNLNIFRENVKGGK